MWLSGPAGAGKSAICHTLAERFRDRGQPVVNFFFFRGDGTRNRPQPLVATLVYQLRHLYPTLDVPLSNCLEVDPLICSASIDEQFKLLLSSPIQTIPRSSPIILIVDGLDECDGIREQEQILDALHSLASSDHSPFLVLIASRAEPHLVMHFNKIGSSVESIFLDYKYRPQDDIRRFVIAKFDEIIKTHHLAQTLGKEWPEKSDIDAITNKSSGQFIYAATVMRFIQYSSDSPQLSLNTIRDMQPAPGHNPFAQLDAVYSYILSKARDIHAVKLILGAHFISDQFEDAMQLVGYEEMWIKSIFADLAPIVHIVTRPHIDLVFYHASLSDYLKNKSRSGAYYVDTGEIAAELSSICLRNFYHSGIPCCCLPPNPNILTFTRIAGSCL